MRLNPDCIRAILLSVEEATDSERIFRYGKDDNTHQHLTKFTHNEIYYHMRQCNASGLLVGFTPCDGGDLVIIRDLSPEGHEFLANIRNNNFWEKVKDISAKIGTPAMSSMLHIAENLATELISGYFKMK